MMLFIVALTIFPYAAPFIHVTYSIIMVTTCLEMGAGQGKQVQLLEVTMKLGCSLFPRGWAWDFEPQVSKMRASSLYEVFALLSEMDLILGQHCQVPTPITLR